MKIILFTNIMYSNIHKIRNHFAGNILLHAINRNWGGGANPEYVSYKDNWSKYTS